MECTFDNHIFEFWGVDYDGGIPNGWPCKCGEKKYRKPEHSQKETS